MEKKLYVAYGSNLNLEQMEHRCPTARRYGVGEIRDYALQFKGEPLGAFATISPQKGASVPAAVWTLRPRDEQRLDLYEGVPRFYSKQTVTVQLQDETVEALVYIMDPRRGFGLPSPEYYQTVRQGYEDFGLDVAKLDAAVQDSSHRLYTALAQEMHQKRSFDLWANGPDETAGQMSDDETKNGLQMEMG